MTEQPVPEVSPACLPSLLKTLGFRRLIRARPSAPEQRHPETSKTRYAVYFCWDHGPPMVGFKWESREKALEGHDEPIHGFKLLLVIHPKPEIAQ